MQFLTCGLNGDQVSDLSKSTSSLTGGFAVSGREYGFSDRAVMQEDLMICASGGVWSAPILETEYLISKQCFNFCNPSLQNGSDRLAM